MGRGQAQALDYKLPQQGFIPVAPSQFQQPQVEEQAEPKQGDYLAHVDGLTDKYYNIKAMLSEYAHDMSKRGIDVTAPDYSQPGGGEAFKTYQKLGASLQYTANDLKNSKDIDETMMKLQAENKIKSMPGFDPRKQASATMNPEEMFYSTTLDPGQEESNMRTRSTTYDRGSSNRLNEATYEQQISQLDEAVRSGQISPVVAEFQKNQLLKNTHELSPYQLTPKNGASGSGKIPPGFTVLKEVTNLANGVWKKGTYKPVLRNGKSYLENTAKRGESTGQYLAVDDKGKQFYKPKIIKSWLKDPETQEVSIEYQDTSIPNDVVSDQPGEAANNFMANNTRYGDPGKVMDYASSLGATDEFGTVVADHPLIAPDGMNEIKAEGSETAARFKQMVDSQIKKLTDLKTTNWFDPTNNWVGVKLPNGKEIKVYKQAKDKFYIDNPEDIITEDYPNGVQSLENLDAKGVTEWLIKAGLSDSDSEPSTPSPDKQKAIDLINKYK